MEEKSVVFKNFTPSQCGTLHHTSTGIDVEATSPPLTSAWTIQPNGQIPLVVKS